MWHFSLVEKEWTWITGSLGSPSSTESDTFPGFYKNPTYCIVNNELYMYGGIRFTSGMSLLLH